jgi:hypothetical protein
MKRKTHAGAGPVAFSLVALTSCGSIDPFHQDPVHRDAVAALGGESSSVPTGPLHRPGQPCTVCHGPEGPASTHFVIAGTVFAGPDHAVGVEGAEILFVDSLGSSPPPGSVLTNCAGNFFFSADLWNPAFPIRVAVASGASAQQMIGHIGRQGSCAFCHKDPRGLDSPGHVYANVPPPSGSTCAANGGAGANP